tara:strand:- start:192 stop:422 length:231 start_codon:yes stop_codon:yes gene_type:complete
MDISSEKSLSAATKRVRAHRERRRQGISLITVPVSASGVQKLIKGGKLLPESAGDKNEVSDAIVAALKEWASSQSA